MYSAYTRRLVFNCFLMPLRLELKQLPAIRHHIPRTLCLATRNFMALVIYHASLCLLVSFAVNRIGKSVFAFCERAFKRTHTATLHTATQELHRHKVCLMLPRQPNNFEVAVHKQQN